MSNYCDWIRDLPIDNSTPQICIDYWSEQLTTFEGPNLFLVALIAFIVVSLMVLYSYHKLRKNDNN